MLQQGAFNNWIIEFKYESIQMMPEAPPISMPTFIEKTIIPASRTALEFL
jgi:hypothetical protein